MAIVYLALGANVGNPKANIEQAIELLQSSVDKIQCAPLYASKAVGYTDQPDFINTAVSGETVLDPAELLKFVKEVEEQVGRVERFRWGPREIDIDIIFYNDSVVQQDNLVIPHPRFAERDFVLQPICDLDPTFIDPLSKRSVKQLLEALSSDQRSLLNKVDLDT
ncbi:MAG TPA: 2-amino-4-hydroxy-6-hydroxymethyldihydropteridine diphosphokinase [Candidatus Saccharimonadales bacterium]|nr:2-amino-4-hydroxy-6-hydroxymethyldihydropteridine diphosphokinase [Candidatus Saccharimonadales bacterium]